MNDHQVEYVSLKTWSERPDVISKFNCFYREKKENLKIEWVPGYLLLTKTHLYCLTQKSNKKNGMVEITVRHPLSSIIKIATKSSCPEIISFTFGEKLDKLSSSNKNLQQEPANNSETASNGNPNDGGGKHEEASSTSSTSVANATTVKSSEANKSNTMSDYAIKGKDWFYVPEYSGEAASAVKRQILEIVDLIH
jgi:hypothetical protein